MTMATYSDTASALRQYFQTNWVDTPIAFENVPLDVSGLPAWVRFTVQFFPGQNIALGSDCVRISGQVVIQVFTRYDVGTGLALTIIDSIRTLFENQVIGTISTREVEVTKIGDVYYAPVHSMTDWYQANVKIYFETTD